MSTALELARAALDTGFSSAVEALYQAERANLASGIRIDGSESRFEVGLREAAQARTAASGAIERLLGSGGQRT